MREKIISLIGAETFDGGLAFLAIGLPIAVILALLLGMGLRFIPWPWDGGDEQEGEAPASEASEPSGD